MKAFLLALLLATSPSLAAAQSYPTRPLKLIVPDGAGGVGDLRARHIAQKLAEALGQVVIVDNRPGGSMIIAAEAAAHSAADGYTLFMGNVVTHSVNPHLFRTLPYRPEEDFAPVTMISSGPLVLVVSSSLPASTLEDLIALAKARPGTLSYGAVGQGSPTHIVMEQIKAIRGADFQFIAYKSTGQFIQDLVAGHLQVSLNYWSILGPHVKSGKLRALGVTAAKRLEVAPEVPTFAEAGLPGLEVSAWQGIMVPAGTPRPIVARLHEEIARVLESPDIRRTIVDTGADVGGNTPESFAAFLRADRERWKKAVADARIPPT
jgi:tripartite-type tricarboxylate transporter receptor subunit TctC